MTNSYAVRSRHRLLYFALLYILHLPDTEIIQLAVLLLDGGDLGWIQGDAGPVTRPGRSAAGSSIGTGIAGSDELAACGPVGLPPTRVRVPIGVHLTRHGLSRERTRPSGSSQDYWVSRVCSWPTTMPSMPRHRASLLAVCVRRAKSLGGCSSRQFGAAGLATE